MFGYENGLEEGIRHGKDWPEYLRVKYKKHLKDETIIEKFKVSRDNKFRFRYAEKDFSLLLKLEHALSPYVAFGIMPLFALANAGVSLEGISINKLMNPVPLGIVCGLFFGKQIGVFLFSYLSIKLKFAEMPSNSNWIKLYGVGILTGIGFTMSLFVGNLAFMENTQHMVGVKIGVLCGSLLSAFVGYFLLLITTNKK